MKVYRLTYEYLIHGEWTKQEIIKTDMSLISRYIVDAKEHPETYRNVKFFIGEFEEIEDYDIKTIEDLFL